MKQLHSPLISNLSTRQLSALGFKQLYRIIDKACEANKTNRMHKDGKPIAERVRALVMSLIFDHGITKEQLSAFQKAIKVTNNVLELPSISSFVK